MGFLDKLFGRKKVDVPRLLSAVAEHGGTGIVQVPYAVLAEFLLSEGSEHQAGAGAMECFVNIDGKRSKVVIDQCLFFSNVNLKQGETLVTVQDGFNFSNMNTNEIASVIKETLTDYISDRNSALAVSSQIINMAGSNYMHTLWAKDQFDVTLESLRSPTVSAFTAKQEQDDIETRINWLQREINIDWHQFNKHMNDLLIGIEDEKLKLEISDLVAEKIIEEWNLMEC